MSSFMENWPQPQPTLFSPDYSDLIVSEEEVSRYMGYGDHTPDEYILDMMRSMMEEMKTLCQPKFGYDVVTASVPDKSSLLLNGEKVSPGKIITHYLKESDYFILLVATAGLEYDHWKENIQAEGDIVKLYVADALGSTIAEAIMALALKHLTHEAGEKGWKITNSYSPGYCGWPVSEQKILFSLLPENFCNVTLTESSLMLPIKSVSAILGMGSAVEKKPYGCAICRKKDCFKRRLPAAQKSADSSSNDTACAV